MANNSTFEEVSYLLIHGTLPNKSQLDEITTWMANSRDIPNEIINLIDSIKHLHPMDVLRTAVSALSGFTEDAEDSSYEAALRKGIELTAKSPSIVAAHHRIRSGNDVIPPNPSLNHSGNFLNMLLGAEPDEDTYRLMDKDFIVHLDHGSNASSFAGRVTASTLADVHACVVSGIATLKGPLHGGAAEGVMKMALEIGDESNVEAYLNQKRENRERITYPRRFD